MAARCPTGFNVDELRAQVRATYERVAREPHGEFHFHRGPDYAVEVLGYDPAVLRELPVLATARFAGVGNPLAIGPVHAGETVLDHACGAGMDLLLAARRIGVHGRAIGVDMTPAMCACAQTAAREAGLDGVIDIRTGLYEALPVEDASVDVVISNGVVNLAPDKTRVFREIERVLKPGGRLYLADVVVEHEFSLRVRNNPDLWAACIGGALPESELHEVSAATGLVQARVVARFASFRGTSAEDKVSPEMRIRAVNFYAHKPAV